MIFLITSFVFIGWLIFICFRVTGLITSSFSFSDCSKNSCSSSSLSNIIVSAVKSTTSSINKSSTLNIAYNSEIVGYIKLSVA